MIIFRIEIALVALNIGDGFNHMAVSYYTSIYLRCHVDHDLLASSQTLIGLCVYGVTKFASNFFGGIASEAFGTAN